LEDSLSDAQSQLKQCKREEQTLLDRLGETERLIDGFHSQERMRSKEVGISKLYWQHWILLPCFQYLVNTYYIEFITKYKSVSSFCYYLRLNVIIMSCAPAAVIKDSQRTRKQPSQKQQQ